MTEPVGIIGAVKGLFEYNRENFMFDRTLNQQRVYQIQKMRVAQVKLYRNDLEELFDLTIRKMDSYLIFNALLLLFTGGLFYEGRLPTDTPAWLLWLWTMSLGSAFFFLSLAIWFAIHASITAQTFQVRLLTQWLRLPIPSADDIHAAAGQATEFEETRAKDMLRVPIVSKRGVDISSNARAVKKSDQLKPQLQTSTTAPVVSVTSTNSAPRLPDMTPEVLDKLVDPFNCVEQFPDIPNQLLKSDLITDYPLFVEHFYLFRDLQKHWQGFDAYCRIGMVVGTNMLLSGLCYVAIAYYVMSYKLWGGLVFPVLLTAFSLIHITTNLRNISKKEFAIICLLVTAPVLLACTAGVHAMIYGNNDVATVMTPFIYTLSGLWMIFLIVVGSEEEDGLPCRFVTVASIDVLGLEEDSGRYETIIKEDAKNISDFGTAGEDENESADEGGSDTPVAVAVPTAQVISQGEERRRRKWASEEGKSFASPHADDLEAGGGIVMSDLKGDEVVEKEEGVLLSTVLESVLKGTPSDAKNIDEMHADIDDEPRKIKSTKLAYRHSSMARRLPWKGYREAGAVIVCLWLFATTYSILACWSPRWGWPTTMPHGDGEEVDNAAVERMHTISAHSKH